ncbi:response regulator [Bavariicoccus seileri]|uniref:response regulator n=1 Tax=Bavariicoccus seileri TaxID=549685 RepID=UPI003F93F2CE
MVKIRVMIVDDEQLIRSGLKMMLESYPDITIVAEAENGQQAVEVCDTMVVDVVLMDIRMPILDGIAATEQIKAKHQAIRILILTTFQDTAYIMEAMEKGASGYLLKDSSPESIRDGIKVAMSGKIVLDHVVSSQFLTARLPAETENEASEIAAHIAQMDLLDREIEIIKLVAKGMNNKEIGQTLFLSEGTIKNHISTILSKLDLRDRTQLALFAVEHKLHLN